MEDGSDVPVVISTKPARPRAGRRPVRSRTAKTEANTRIRNNLARPEIWYVSGNGTLVKRRRHLLDPVVVPPTPTEPEITYRSAPFPRLLEGDPALYEPLPRGFGWALPPAGTYGPPKLYIKIPASTVTIEELDAIGTETRSGDGGPGDGC